MPVDFLARTLIESGEAVAVQPDGKILLAGSATDGFGRFLPDLLLVRLNADGSRDSSFGTNGQVLFDFGGDFVSHEEAFAVAVQADGMIVVAGRSALTNTATETVDFDFAVARFTDGGSIDPTFGTAGFVRTDFGTTGDAARGVVVAADGTIYVVGESGGDAALASYTSAGVLNPAFDTDGKLKVDLGGADSLRALVLQADGKLVAAGTTGADFAVARFTAAGALDPAFGTGGIALADFGRSGDAARAVALDSTGRIVAGGTAALEGSKNDFALARFTAAGVLDTAFSSDGKSTIDAAALGSSGGPERIEGLAIQADGRILAGGSAPDQNTRSQWAAARVNDDGSVDAAFGTNGVARLTLSTSTFGTVGGVALAGGQLVLAGTRGSDAPLDSRSLSAMKLTATGTLDAGFDGDGLALFEVKGSADNHITASRYLDDGSLLVANEVRVTPRNSFAGSQIALTHYLADGTLDPAFGQNGTFSFDFGLFASQANSVLVQPDGKIVVAGFRATRMEGRSALGEEAVMARLNPNGTLDASFGSGGLVTDSGVIDGESRPTSFKEVVRQADGSFAVLSYLRLADGKGLPTVRHYSANGVLHTAYAGDGGAEFKPTPFGFDLVSTLRPLADGKLLVAGYTDQLQVSLTRLQSDGTPDLSFGVNGTALAGQSVEFVDVVVEADGSFTAGVLQLGRDARGGKQTIPRVLHFLSNGSIDPAFGIGGQVITSFMAGIISTAEFTRDAEGRFLFAMRYTDSANNIRGGLFRFEADGSADQQFGPDAGIDLNLLGIGSPEALQVRADGRVLVLGNSPDVSDGAIAQFQADPVPPAQGLLSFAARRGNTPEFTGNAVVDVTRLGGSVGTVTVHYAVTGGTATNGSDFNTVSGDLTFGPGETVRQILVPILTDPTGEVAETIELTLSNPTGGAALQHPARHTLTILQNNGPLGALDPSFGEGGLAVSDHTAALNDFEQVTDLVIAPDGKIVAVGQRRSGPTADGFDFFVSRFNTDGTADESFGGTGAVQTDFFGELDFAKRVTVLPDGKILVAGSASLLENTFEYNSDTPEQILLNNERVAFVRYNADGTLDRTFGDGGLVVFDQSRIAGITGTEVYLNGLDFSFGPTGDVLAFVSLEVQTKGDRTGAVQRTTGLIHFLADGTYDAAYAGDGLAETPVVFSIYGLGTMTRLPNGQVIVAGGTGDNVGNSETNIDELLVAAKFNADGSVDTTFGTNGYVSLSTSAIVSHPEVPRSLAVQADGKIVIGGTTSTGFIVRLNANGTPDLSFSGDGIVLYDGANPPSSSASVLKVAPLPNGKIAVAGYTSDSASSQQYVMQLLADGTQDAGFGVNGVRKLDVFRSDSTANVSDAGLAITPSNEIIAGFGGTSKTLPSGDTRFGLVRLQTVAQFGKIEFAQSAMSVEEADGLATVLVRRTGGSAGVATVDYQLTSGSATAGADFLPLSGTLTFADGETAREILVPITTGDALELTETFTITLSNPTGGAALGATTLETISLLDGPDRVEFLSPVFNVIEGAGYVTVGVVRKGGTSSGATVDIDVRGLEAVSGLDFDARSGGTLHFAAGQRVIEFTIFVRNDAIAEGRESLELTLSNPSGGPALGAVTKTTVNIFESAPGKGNNAGGLDRRFGTGGSSRLDVFGGGATEQSYATLVQADGRIIVVGETGGSQSDFLLARYTADGQLDPTFATAGALTADFFGLADSARAAVLDVEGRILVAGWALRDGRADFAVARYLPNGTPDLTFDGDGKATFDFDNLDDRVTSIALAPDGKIVLGGSTFGVLKFDMALAVLNPNGTLDTTFSSDGRLTVDFEGRQDQLNALLVQPDGNIVAGGTATRLASTAGKVNEFEAALFRVTPTGAFDSSFDGDGKVIATDLPGVSTLTSLHALALLPNGHLVFAGAIGLGLKDVLVGDFDSSGKLQRYSSKNFATLFSGSSSSSSVESAEEIFLQDDGSFYLAGGSRPPGGSSDHLFVIRYEPDFSLDPSFGLGGVALVPTLSPARGLALTPAGDVVTTGGAFQVSQLLHSSAAPKEGVFFLDSLAYTVQETAGSLSVTVSRPHESNYGAVSVDYVLVGMSATAGQDFTPVAGTLHFRETETTKTFSIPILNDAIREEGETFGVLLSNPTGGAELSSASFATVSIPANDPQGVQGAGFFSFNRSTGGGGDFISESLGFAFIGVGRGSGSLGAVLIDYFTSNGSATAGDDFVPQFGTLTFAAGQTSKTIKIDLLPDDSIEGDEHFFINFSAPRGGSALDGEFKSLKVTIPDEVPAENFTYAGRLDTTFDTDGRATLDSGEAGSDSFLAVARQPDGKIVAAGNAGDSGGLLLVRYLANGALDTAFGTAGKVITSLGSPGYESALAVRVQPDGKILVVGASAGDATRNEIVFARYSAAGVLDATFGVKGLARTSLPAGVALSLDQRSDVVIGEDGKVTVGLTLSNGLDTDLALLRFSANGKLDTTFGTSGTLTYDLGLRNDTLTSLLLQPEGRVLATFANGLVRAIRFNQNGSVDENFGDDGLASANPAELLLPAGLVYLDSAGIADSLPLPNGDFLLLGSAGGSAKPAGSPLFSTVSLSNGLLMLRYHADGTLDTTYGVGGAKQVPQIDGFDVLGASFDEAGKLLVGGRGTGISRLLLDGRIDPGFGVNGRGANPNLGSLVYDMVTQPDGHILLVGGGALSTNAEAVLPRLVGGPVAGSLRLNTINAKVSEDGGSLIIPVERVAGFDGAVSVTFSTSNGTALAGLDYTAVSQTLSWADLEDGIKTVSIPILDDLGADLDETLQFALTNPTGGALLSVRNTGTAKIIDNDNPGAFEFSLPAYEARETDATATITVKRTGGKMGAVSVNYAVGNGGTAIAGQDYVGPVAGTLNFADGETVKTFTVSILDDSTLGEDQTVVFALSDPQGGATLGGLAQARLTILENELPSGGAFGFGAPRFEVSEDGKSYLVSVLRSPEADGAGSVTLTVAPGTAQPGVDFLPFTAVLNFAAGQRSASVPIPILNNADADGDRTVLLSLSAPVGGRVLTSLTSPTIGPDGTATLIIGNEDVLALPLAPGAIQLLSGEITAKERSGFAPVVLVRNGGSAGAVSIDLTLAEGSAKAGKDFTGTTIHVDFADGELSKTVFVPLRNDLINEATESFSVALTNPGGGASLGTKTGATVTVLDDDIPALRDFNGDGKLDLITQKGTKLLLRFGDGAGGFGVGTALPTVAGASSFIVGDFNGDRRADVVVLSKAKKSIFLVAGNGDGTFAAPVGFLSNASTGSLLAADFNKDGRLDVAALGAKSINVLLNTGAGFAAARSFALPKPFAPLAMVSGDFNEDGRTDLTVLTKGATAKVLTFRGDDQGGFFRYASVTTFGKGVKPLSLIAADLNNDGHVDLAAIVAKNQVAIGLGRGRNGYGTFGPMLAAAAGKGPALLALADVDDDLDDDLITTNAKNIANIVVSNGGLTFAPPSPLSPRFKPATIAACDINGDGDIDLVLSDKADKFKVALGAAGAGFTLL